MKILITGATGFIGSKFIKSLSLREFNIKLLSRKKVKEHETIVCDFLNDPIPENICESIDIVFHFAGYAHDLEDSSKNKKNYFRVNVEATKSLLKSAVKYKVKKFIYLSSVKARGVSNIDKFNNEKSEILPDTIYGISKYEAENEIIKACKSSSINYLIIRPALVYGPSVKGNLSLMIKAIERRLLPPLPNIGNKRSLVHVDDLINAINYLTFDINLQNEIFIITDGIEYSTKQIYDTICMVRNKKIPSWSLPVSILNAISYFSPSIKLKINKLLRNEYYSSEKFFSTGYKPKKNLNKFDLSDYL